MNTVKEKIQSKKLLQLLMITFLLIILQSCSPDKKSKIKEQVEEKKDNAIEIITNLVDFQMSDTITSGWNTFRYVNNSSETHFFLLGKYPEGKTIEDTQKEVGPPFQNGMNLINEGKPKEGFAEFGKLPEWYFKVVVFGGSGLLSAKHTSLTTIKLEPGYYVMECYVKNSSGIFHSNMGMAKAIIVTDKKSTFEPPKASINITISSTEGIAYDGPITKGEQIISVFFKDQIAHENFVGHDINLVRLNESANLEVLEKWMNWADPKGLISPSPEGITFLGGVNDMTAGSTGYFKVILKPGKYALISEVPNSLRKNLLKTFTVSE